MKITIASETLYDSLTYLQGVVENNSANRILSHIMLTAKNNQLELLSTDTLLYLKEIVSANISLEGSTTVAFDILFQTLGQLKSSNNMVGLTLSEEGLMVESNGFKGCIKTLPPESFPAPYTGEYNHTLDLPVADLKQIITKTKSSMCADETRYNLNGIYLHQKVTENNQQVLAAASTDGHKLAMAEIDLPPGANLGQNLLIPKKTVDKLSSLLSKVSCETIKLSVIKNNICFSTNTITLQSQLVDGTFPDYSLIIPKHSEAVLSIDGSELISAIELISLYSENKHRAVKLHLSGNLLTVTANREDGSCYGEKSITLNQTYPEIELSFNARYLKEILNLIESKEAQLHLSSDTAIPVWIKDSENQSFSFIIMPMRK